MLLAERVVQAASERAGGLRLERVVIGLSYTAVLLEDGGCGVAMTLPEEGGARCSSAPELERPLAGQTAREALQLLLTQGTTDRAVGLACANALLNRPRQEDRTGDALKYIDLRPGDRVGMVGCFWPMLDALRARIKELLVFERKERGGDFWLPAEDAPRMLPGCQVALITSSSIVNDTLGDLLKAASGLREVVMLGASTPLVPEVFSGTPVTWVCGVQVTDAESVLRTASEGGGMFRFRGSIKKVCLAMPRGGVGARG